MSEKVNCFSPDVANLLAMWYVCSSTQQDYRLKATIWLRANANRHNHAKSQYDLSVLLTGEDNEEERIKWLMRAVDNKYPPALYKHGFELLSLGDADGIQFIEKSLKTDSLTADHFYKAGEAYTHGLYHLQVNLDRGKKLYVKAAKKGSVEAQVLLGNKYFEGEPNFFDLAQAINWYKMAAFKYNEEARLQLQCIRTMDEFRGRRMLAKLVCKFFDLKTHIENQATDYFWLLIIAFIFIGIPLLLIVGLIKWLMS